MKLIYTINDEVYRNYYRDKRYTHMPSIISIVLQIITFELVVYLNWYLRGKSLAMFIGFIFISYIVFVRYENVELKRAREAKIIDNEIKLSISEDGYTIERTNNKIFSKWRVQITEMKHFIIFDGSDQQVIIPKAVFDSDDKMKEFIKLIEEYKIELKEMD